MNAQKAVIVHVAEPFKQRKNKNINNGKRSRSYTITYWIWAFSSCSLLFEYRQNIQFTRTSSKEVHTV